MDSDKAQEHMVNALVAVIRRVDEVTDRDFISSWLRVIPVSWAKQISETIQDSANWGLNLDIKKHDLVATAEG